ncbi:MAG: exodeoxyribonuclease III [Alphaproteobacteria bacterium]
MRIVSWNINSVRLRIGHIERLVAEAAPDVLCLQETKVQDPQFPVEPFERLGYKHRLIHGMKSYNGVAILSRVPFKAAGMKGWCDKEDCRHAFATLPGGVELHNYYIPAGGDVADPEANPKFAHKLRFLAELTAWWQARRKARRKAILVGDLNIAPLESDVWSHKALLDVVSHTPIEVAWLAKLQAAHGFVDAVRHFVPAEEKLYSWWSYRAADWRAADRGRRLDHIWVTPALAEKLDGAAILKDARGWEVPSDHVPVIADIRI